MKEAESMLVHDLKTPLTGIKGYTDVLIDEILGPLNNDQRKALESVQTCYEIALSIIDDILYLTTLEQGMMEPVFQPVDVAGIIDRAVNIHRGLMKDKRIRLKLGNRGTAFCMGDEKQLLRVLTNLLNNSIRFTSPGGMIEISTKRMKKTAGLTEAVVVSITDTGIGIPADMHDRIFEKFRQADRDFTRQGNGLGLAICREIVTRHGGRIWVESPVYGTGGSRFSFGLPPYTGKPASCVAETQQVY
jgi:signal transduction histidine kinase